MVRNELRILRSPMPADLVPQGPIYPHHPRKDPAPEHWMHKALLGLRARRTTLLFKSLQMDGLRPLQLTQAYIPPVAHYLNYNIPSAADPQHRDHGQKVQRGHRKYLLGLLIDGTHISLPYRRRARAPCPWREAVKALCSQTPSPLESPPRIRSIPT